MARKDSQSSAESEDDWKGSEDNDESDDESIALDDESSLDDVVKPTTKTTKAEAPATAKAAKAPTPAPAAVKAPVKKRIILDESDSDDDLFKEDVKENKAVATNKPPAAPRKSPPSAKVQKAETKEAPVHNSSVSSSSSSKTNNNNSSSSSSTTPAAPAAGGSVDITRGPNITTESRAKELILQYMKQQNRPYSAIQVYDNLHHRINKPFVDKCLTSLSEGEGQAPLQMKQYGKASIFFYNQSLIPSIKASEMESLDNDIIKLKKKVNENETLERTLAKTLTELTQEPTDDDLDAVITTLQSRTREKQNRVNKIGNCNLDPSALHYANRALVHFRSEYKKRKANCMDVVETLAENMNKKTKVVMNDLGLEVDE